MEELSMKDVELIVKTMADVAIANEKYFSQLDSVVGDADFGVSLSAGFRAVLDKWDTFDRSSPSPFLMKVGVVITSNVGGVSGPIWGTGFMKAGITAKDKTSLTLADLVAMLRAAMKGMMERGGASLGDKTLLDAIAPTTDKLEEWSQRDTQDVVGAFQAAADTVSKVPEATRGWIAKRGRQSYTGERSIGTLDPGMVAVATMLQAVVKALKDAHA